MSSIRAGVKIDRNRLRESASPVAHKSKLPVYGKWVGLMVIASAANRALATILYEPFNYDATSTPRLDGQTASTGKSWQVAGSNAGNPGPEPCQQWLHDQRHQRREHRRTLPVRQPPRETICSGVTLRMQHRPARAVWPIVSISVGTTLGDGLLLDAVPD